MAVKSITAMCDKRKPVLPAEPLFAFAHLSQPLRGSRYYLHRMPTQPRGHGHDTRYVRMQKNFCFACGKNNPAGMRLKFTYEEERDTFICRFRLGKRFTGPPGHCHGGIIATILD